MKKFAVYTAFSKGYDTLSAPPAHWRKQVSFTAFLEDNPKATGWAVKSLHQGFNDPCRDAKIHKTLSHVYFPDQEYTLWIDGSIAITTQLTFAKMVRQCANGCDLVIFKHRRRNCIYAEAKECLKLKKDSPDLIYRQMEKYWTEGYPNDNGLIEGCVILRRHTRNIIRFNEAWHEMIMNYSRRDQLSFNYVAHKLKLKFCHWPGIYTDNPHFTYHPHVGHIPNRVRKSKKKD